MEDNVKQLEYHYSEIMKILGISITQSNKDTPRRIAKMLDNEVFCNRNDLNIEELNSKMTLFDNENEYNFEVIKMEGIEFSSMCEHHWMPFFGKVDVEYIPKAKIIGLSKIPRVVKYFGKRPQLQERLTNDIGNYLVDLLNPLYLKVTIQATHTCVMCRGAESNCQTRTSFLYEGI